jgi:hypothetical protein
LNNPGWARSLIMKTTRSKLFAMMLFGIYSSDISITTVTIIRDGPESLF